MNISFGNWEVVSNCTNLFTISDVFCRVVIKELQRRIKITNLSTFWIVFSPLKSNKNFRIRQENLAQITILKVTVFISLNFSILFQLMSILRIDSVIVFIEIFKDRKKQKVNWIIDLIPIYLDCFKHENLDSSSFKTSLTV